MLTGLAVDAAAGGVSIIDVAFVDSAASGVIGDTITWTKDDMFDHNVIAGDNSLYKARAGTHASRTCAVRATIDAVTAGPAQFNVEARANHAYVLSGNLDLMALIRMREIRDELAAAGAAKVTFDAEQLTFLDSTGLRSLLLIHKLGVHITIARPPERVRRLLTTTGLADIFTVVD